MDSSAPSASESKKPQTITVAYNQGEFSWPTYQKMADAYKEKTGNTVEFKYIPAGQFDNWVQTQFVGGTEPEIIMTSDGNKADWFKNGWIVDLLPSLEENSPFTGGIWKDSFLDGVIDSALDKTDAANPKLYGVPDQLVTVNLYYNKDIFSKIGVTQPPATITDFFEVAKKATDAGYVGFSIQNSMDWNLGWFEDDINQTIWRSELSNLDTNQSGQIELSEWAAAVKNGKITADTPQLKSFPQFLKDLAPYLNKGFNTASWEFEGLFNDGKSAMTLNGSWYPNQHLQSKFPVNYGIAPIPYMDQGYSSLGDTERHNYVVGGTPSLTVTRNAKNNGKLDAAIDFLRFWTDPIGGAKILTDGLYQIPVVKNVPVPELLTPIMEGFGSDKKPLTDTVVNFTAEQKDGYFKMKQQLLDGKLTPDQVVKSESKDIDKYVNDAIKAHPEWNLDG